MIMMPLGPQFMRLFAIGPQHFGFLVSAYTFAAAASGFVAAFWIDRFDRRRALLALYAGFIVATALCGFAPDYPLLLAGADRRRRSSAACSARLIVRRSSPTSFPMRAARAATAVVAAAFSLAAVAGRAAGAVDRRALFVARAVPGARRRSASSSALVALARCFRRSTPTSRAARAAARSRSCAPIFGVPNHLRAFAFMIVLMLLGVHGRPVHRRLQRRQRRRRRGGPAAHLFRRRRDLARHRAGDRLARRPLRQAARCSRSSRCSRSGPILVHHASAAAAARLGGGGCRSLFFVFVPGRFGPATALVTGSVEPRLRGSFMSFNASVQQLASGVASLVGGPHHRPRARRHAHALRLRSAGCRSAARSSACGSSRRIRVVDGSRHRLARPSDRPDSASPARWPRAASAYHCATHRRRESVQARAPAAPA